MVFEISKRLVSKTGTHFFNSSIAMKAIKYVTQLFLTQKDRVRVDFRTHFDDFHMYLTTIESLFKTRIMSIFDCFQNLHSCIFC